ncbi:dynamin family protein [Thermodesulfobacteriota bacterium]
MYRENYINSLRMELLAIVAEQLSPIALRYGYSEVPLESNIRWRPQVLVLGNYSSGKSALINEFLGADIQATGQAPTDDSFTVITHDGSIADDIHVAATEERDGKYLLNDPEYPFVSLKKHGERFAAHFRLKKVNASFLKNLALVDTPGMLDSITERDRGYDYQEVVGDLAQISDLILVLFDPHKAGTIREAHISLRETLPAHTFEDRVIFVLNRIDECASLEDLLRVYGTLCWNLSQITGRKDIPMIHLTYSPRAAADVNPAHERNESYLRYLENQRDNLKRSVLEAPRYRLDRLATFVETHAERLSHFLESLINYRKMLQAVRLKYTLVGILTSILIGAAVVYGMLSAGIPGGIDFGLLPTAGSVVMLALLFLWFLLPMKYFVSRFHRQRLRDIDNLTNLENQTRRDSWAAVKDLTYDYLKKTSGRFQLREVKKDYAMACRVSEEGAKEIREALSELATITPDELLTEDNRGDGLSPPEAGE